VCKFWLTGSCKKSAEDCLYSHFGEVEKLREKCKFYTNGCAFGSACRYMHETYPCAKFFIERCDESDCKFSHASLDDRSRSLVKQDLLAIISDTKVNISEAETSQEKQRLLDSLIHLRSIAASKGISLEPAEEDDDEDEDLLSVCQNDHGIAGEEVDFTPFNGPYGELSKRRYINNGTYVNFRYAQNNMAKFEAYEEMEKRIMILYNEISIDKYESLSKQLRNVD